MFCYEGVPRIRNDVDCSGWRGMLSLLVSYESCMASVWKRSNSKYLTACFRDHTGRQRRITTKETNRKIAQKLSDEYEKASRTKRSLKQAQAVRPIHPEAFDLVERQHKTGHLSNRFANLLAAAGLRPKKNHKSTFTWRFRCAQKGRSSGSLATRCVKGGWKIARVENRFPRRGDKDKV